MPGLRGIGYANEPFGTGHDGTGLAIFGANPIVGTVSLTKPTFVKGDLTINNGGILQLQSFPLFVNGKLTFVGTGKIRGVDGNPGGNGLGIGAGGGLGGNGAGANYCGSGFTGGRGGFDTPHTAGETPPNQNNAYGGAGGSGGIGAVTLGGAGGLNFEIGNNGYVEVFSPQSLGFIIGASGLVRISGGNGGGGGGDTGGTSDGGGGGGGAGVMIVCASQLVGAYDGCIFNIGGAGGNGVNGGGGGGGGGGGVLILAYSDKNDIAFTPAGCVPGGAFGTSTNGGAFNGLTGASGRIIEFAL